MKKKLVGLLLSAMTAVSSATMLSACGPDDPPDNQPPPPDGPGNPGENNPYEKEYCIGFYVNNTYVDVFCDSAEELATQIPTAPTKPGKTFLGWYNTKGVLMIDALGNVVCMPEKNEYSNQTSATLYAKYQGLLNIRYETFGYENNSNNPTEVVIEDNTSSYYFNNISVDYSKNEEFLGWYTTPDFRAGTMVSNIYVGDGGIYDTMGTLTLYAKIKRQININYVLNGGENNDANEKHYTCFDEYDNNDIELYAPTKLHHAFVGWYTDANFTNRVDHISKNTIVDTLYAKWESLYITSGATITGLTDYAKTLTHITIPNFLNGESIVAIGEDFCKNNTNIEKITIESGIRYIRAGAFSGCTALDVVELPNTLVAYDATSFEPTTTLAYESGSSTILSYDTFLYENIENLVIADSVATISAQAFLGNKTLKTIDLGSVVNIGDNAFNGCTSLTSIKLNRNMHSIGIRAFSGCKALENVEWVGESTFADLIEIGDYAFYNCTSLTSFTVPDTCRVIGDYAFTLYSTYSVMMDQKQSPLKTLTFEDNCQLQSIGNYAFYNTSIDSLNLPGNLDYIGDYAFNSCKNLESVTFGNDGEGELTIKRYAFAGCYILNSFELPTSKYSIRLDSYILADSFRLFELTIPSSVVRYYNEDSQTYSTSCLADIDNLVRIRDLRWDTSESLGYPNLVIEVITDEYTEFTRALPYIDGDYMYSDSNKTILLGVVNKNKKVINDIPSSVTTISSYAFAGNQSITSVTIPENVTTIPYHCFESCTNLTEVIMHNNVTTIDYGAFAASGIENITLSTKLETINSYAFWFCSNLKSITIPSSVISIQNNAFESCSGLTTVDMSSAKMTTISMATFSECSSLTTVYIPATVKTIEESAFYSCKNLVNVNFASGSELELIKASAFTNTGIKNISLPSTLKSIASGAFTACYDLETVIIAEGSTIDSIGSQTFSSCQNLKTIILPSTATLTELDSRVFDGCIKLVSLTIPASVSSIDTRAFEDCVNLAQLRIMNKDFDVSTLSHLTNVEIVLGALNNEDDTTKFESEITTSNGFILKTIGTEVWLVGVEDTSVTELNIPNTVTHIAGYALCNLPITSVTIPESVVYIGEASFGGTELTTVTLPSSLVYLGYGAFEGCESLESVNMSACTNLKGVVDTDNGNKCMLQYTFRECTSLTSVTFPLTNAGFELRGTFSECTALTHLEIPNYVTSLYATFRECTSLESVAIGSGVTVIDYGTFQDCTKLSSVTCEGELETIGDVAFENCSSLITFDFGTHLTSLGSSAFMGCSSLRSAILPEGLVTLSAQAFSGCSSLTAVVIPRTVDSTTYHSSTFNGCYHIAQIRYLHESNTILNSIPSHAYNHVEVITNSTESFATAIDYVDGFITLTSGSDVYLLGVSDTTIREITSLPSAINKIASYAFYQNSHVSRFITTNNITSVGRYAFSECVALNQVVLDGMGEATLGEGVFANSKALTKVSFGDYAIKNIGFHAFHQVDNLRSIHIPNSVTTIDDYAFASIANLNYVYIGENSKLTSIGMYAFSGAHIYNEVFIPKGVTQIEMFAFNNAIFGGVRVDSRANITLVDTQAFTNAVGLDIGILKNVNTIGNYAFMGVTFNSPEDVVWNINRVVTIGAEAFKNASVDSDNGISIVLDIGATNTMSIGNNTFMGARLGDITLNSGIFNFGNAVFKDATIKSFTVGAGVDTQITQNMFENSSIARVSLSDESGITSIGQYAFANCWYLENIRLPINTRYVNQYAFKGCSSLRSIEWSHCENIKAISEGVFEECVSLNCVEGTFTMGANVTSIGARAFYRAGVSSIVIGNKVTSIGDYAFTNNSYMSTITIPKSVTSIGDYAFVGNYLTSVTFESGSQLETIGEQAFSGTKLTSIIIPKTVTSLGIHAFSMNRSLNTVEFESGSVLTTISESVFDGCIIGTISLPSSITSIAENAFHECKIGTITLNEGLETIGNHAFSLAETDTISLPITVTSIGSSAFSGSKIKVINLNEGLETIGGYAFSSCSIYSLTIPSTVTECGSGILHGSLSVIQVYNKSALSPDLFEDTASQLSEHYEYSTTGQFTYNLSVTNDYVYLSKSGASILVSWLNSSAHTVTFPTGVTEIGSGAFKGNENIYTVCIPATVKIIGREAFMYCGNLSSFSFEEGSVLETIGESAFHNGYTYHKLGLRGEIVLPSTVKTIERYAFYNTSITAINLPNGLKTIGASAFNGTKLTSIHIPSSVDTMGSYVFNDCEKLESITFDSTIGLETLDNLGTLNSLRELVLPEGITSFGDGYHSFDLDILVLPSTLTYIPTSSITNVGTLVIREGSELNGMVTATINQIGHIVFLGNEVPDILKDENYLEFFKTQCIHVSTTAFDTYREAVNEQISMDFISTIDTDVLNRIEELLGITL